MDKMILADKTELVIKEGAAIGSATTVVDDFTAPWYGGCGTDQRRKSGICQILYR